VRPTSSPICARPSALSLLEQAYPVGLADNCRVRHVQKQPTINYCWNSEQLFLEGYRVRNWPEVAVEDIVAIVRDPRLAIRATP
jgi:hypothetical protein